MVAVPIPHVAVDETPSNTTILEFALWGRWVTFLILFQELESLSSDNVCNGSSFWEIPYSL